MITRLGTCRYYSNNTFSASILPWSLQRQASSRAHRAFSRRPAVHSLLPFVRSSVHQIHTDISAPDTAPGPRGVHAMVRETDRQIDNFISVL